LIAESLVEAGNGEWGMGNGEWGIGKKEEGIKVYSILLVLGSGTF